MDADPIVQALAEQSAELAGLITGLDDEHWQRPSRCEGWTVADVVLHLAQTNEMAVGSATGRFGEVLGLLTEGLDGSGATSADAGADLMVARDRHVPPAAVLQRWQASSAALIEEMQTLDLSKRVTWIVGELSARTLATTRLAETWIHTGDVAWGLGVKLAPSDRLRSIARLAWRTLPYAFGRAGATMAGPVAFELTGPGGEAWSFLPDDDAVTVVQGDAQELCLVAARRVDPAETSLHAEGPDAAAVLELVRTYA
jgi:uncharacterized protein (TIGR03084 family)